jgi:hypothetical protein
VTEIAKRSNEAKRMEEMPETIRLGSWHQLKVQTEKGAIKERLVCVMAIGSNYAEVEAPGGSSWRIHFDEWDEETKPEPNARQMIEKEIEGTKQEVSELLEQVQAVTARLGMTTTADEAGTALATLSGQADVAVYKNALEKAKEEELPALFEKIEKKNNHLAIWMKSEILPVKAVANRAKLAIGEIEGRIFNVEIYAGISEEAKEIRCGEPARFDEKLRVFQAKLFADEECLLDYKAGGMDFQKIGDFDRWIAKRKNLERLLPYPRCLVAMQVRRNDKDREGDEDYAGVLGAFIKFKHEAFDKWTFLYVRNGERLYRIGSKLEFGRLIFPSRNEFTNEPLMFKGHGDNVDFKTVREHESDLTKAAEKNRLREKWNKQNPYKRWKKAKEAEWRKEREAAIEKARAEAKPDSIIGGLQDDKPPSFSHFSWENANPHGRDHDDPTRYFESWESFDKSNVHYDEALRALTDKARQWNRASLVIQGLFDRSEILHPHPKAELWDPKGFASAVELVYDGEHVLHDGAPPDFEAYRAKLNESLGPDSVTIGQEAVWLTRERAREQERRDNDWRLKLEEKHVREYWRPSNDSGPGFLAKIAKWQPRARRAVFHWTREPRAWWRSHEGKQIQESIQVDAKDLFNASGYRRNDHLQFYRDPRTRADYVQWAPFLLTCEDWLGGKTKPHEPEKRG